jgi:ribosomal protein L37AE/L43A
VRESNDTRFVFGKPGLSRDHCITCDETTLHRSRDGTVRCLHCGTQLREPVVTVISPREYERMRKAS